MQINTVTIVGGGSSGWMTAALLSKLCPHLDITLVESKTTPTVGVGESTLGHINRYLRLLELKDEDWMAYCNATYKNSIRFTNFKANDGTHFEYPFVDNYDFSFADDGGLHTWSELSAAFPDRFDNKSFANFFAMSNTLLATHNKSTDNADGMLPYFRFEADTAYHMDAQKFGEFLKEKVALPNGVKHMYNDVHSYIRDEDGNLAQIMFADATYMTSDLWIDCTGFRSILLEEFMGEQFLSFESHLANNKAWAVRLPYTNRKEQMHNVTDCHALGNGWVWNIPLWNRIGTGYVYSSRFIDSTGALEEFKKHLATCHNPEYLEDAKFFHIDIKHGRRRRAWSHNVVGIGLAYGFIEPLESTGLLTTHENIIKLTNILNNRGGYVTNTERTNFNMACEYDVENFKEFVSMHYAYSTRTDTPYWRWCTQWNHYEPDAGTNMIKKYNGYHTVGMGLAQNNSFMEEWQGANFILAGLGIRPVAIPEFISARTQYTILKQHSRVDELKELADNFESKFAKYEDYVKGLPSHYEFLRDRIYGGVDEYDD